MSNQKQFNQKLSSRQPRRLNKLLGFTALLVGLSWTTASTASQIVRLSGDSSPQVKVLRGYLRGTVGLHNIVGNRDQRRQRCMGYGSASPDHQIEITQNLSRISLQVRSRARDTTLVIRGPKNSIFCADDSQLGKDAGMTLSNLQPGLYQVWVGAFDSGDKFPYTLSIR